MNARLPSQFRKAIWYFLLAYRVVTIAGILLTITFAALFKPPSFETRTREALKLGIFWAVI